MAAPAPLVALASVDDSALRWLRLAPEHRGFRLQAGETGLAEVRWPERFGSLARAEFSDRTLELHRAGFLAPHVIVRRAPGGEPVARLNLHLHRSVIELPGHAGCTLARQGLRVPAWNVTGADGVDWIHLEPVEERGRLLGGLVSVAPAVRSDAALPVLLALSWYVLVQSWLEEEAALAGSAALSAVFG